MMTAAQAMAYRQSLLALIRRLDQARTQLREDALRPEGGETSGGLSNVPLHPADLGSHAYEEDIALSLVASKEQMIAEINAALARLDQGMFGRCEGCAQAIPRARLQALPYARYCITCAQQFEENPPA